MKRKTENFRYCTILSIGILFVSIFMTSSVILGIAVVNKQQDDYCSRPDVTLIPFNQGEKTPIDINNPIPAGPYAEVDNWLYLVNGLLL